MKPTCSICGWVVTYDPDGWGSSTNRGDHCVHTWSEMHVACVESQDDYHRCDGAVTDTIQCVCVCHVPAPTDAEVQVAIDKLLAMERELT